MLSLGFIIDYGNINDYVSLFELDHHVHIKLV